jgi:D-beta-D-heptose 7-phosphate kinase/D-beta-D-heptose 1-phosphate adenosyltransferase
MVASSSAVDRLLEEVSSRTILVIGEAMLDVYLEGPGRRLCREAPVPIVTLSSRVDVPGAAGNVACNVRSLGGRAVLVSVVGADDAGRRLTSALRQRGVWCEDVGIDASRLTLTKQRVIGDGQLLLRMDSGTIEPVNRDSEWTVMAAIERWHGEADAIVVSDYGYGILTPRVIGLIGALQQRDPRILVVDSKMLTTYRGLQVTVAKPNYEEAARLLGEPPVAGSGERFAMIARRGTDLLTLTGARYAIVTLDSDGAIVVQRGRPPYRASTAPLRHARSAGAGDTFAAGLALGLAAGTDIQVATDLAAAAAAVVVSKEGTSVCTSADLRQAFSSATKLLSGMDEISACVRAHRARGRRIVLTNGCFDILHRGHIAYLARAKSLGDVLVVAVNTDDGVRRLKGPDRPVNSLEDRVEVLAALGCVDHVVAFGEDLPEKVIRAVVPDVFVKGGDYTRDRLPEAGLVESLGGQVRILPYVNDRSTTGLIRRIRSDTSSAEQAHA